MNADLLFFASAFILGRHIDDAVCVDVEGDIDLWQSAWGRWDADQVELAEYLVILCHLAFTLEHSDRHGCLIIFGSRKNLAFLGRDRCVAIDKPREHAA